MPELPEVETVCRGLAPFLVGNRLEHVQVNRPNLRFDLPANMQEVLTGSTVQKIHRRAKYVLITLNNNYTWLIHLGMSGKFRIDEASHKHDHVIIKTAQNQLAYNDVRRFGYMDLIPTAGLYQHKHLNALGVEPLLDGLNPGYLFEITRNRKAPIKNLLLDQRLIVGIGNIYASEALFLTGIHPETFSGNLTQQHCQDLSKNIKIVLEKAIKAGGSTLRDHQRPDGTMGYFQHNFTVYGRTGEQCVVCTTPIEKIVQAGRSSFFCPKCQPMVA